MGSYTANQCHIFTGRQVISHLLVTGIEVTIIGDRLVRSSKDMTPSSR